VGRRQLSRCIQQFRQTSQPATLRALTPVHRLGLTFIFNKGQRHNNDERPILEYYDLQDKRCGQVHYYPKLVYPLPPVLQFKRAFGKDALDFAPIKKIRDRRQEWTKKTPQEDAVLEEQGKVLTLETSQRRQTSYHPNSLWSKADSQSLLCRHFLLLAVMVHSVLCGAPQQAIVAGFLALTHPYYAGSGMRDQDPERAHHVTHTRVDIYWYLGKAMCMTYAAVDLPLACLHMANRLVQSQSLPCISEQARLVLFKMEILLQYGFYNQARDLFCEWVDRLPQSSWLYEELVMLYVSGMFHHVQDVLVEIYITERNHTECSALPCYSKHVEPMVRSISNQIFLLKSILYRCLSNLTVREDFRDDCKMALQICMMYHYTVLKIGFRNTMSYWCELKQVYEQLNWIHCSETSSHYLEPFLMPIPYSILSEMFWSTLFGKAKSLDLTEWQNKSLCQDVRQVADYYYTLLVSGLFHRALFDVKCSDTKVLSEWIKATIQIYHRCTDSRHHRIVLLEKLDWKLGVGAKLGLEGEKYTIRKVPDSQLPQTRSALKAELAVFPNLHHPKMTLASLSAQHLTRRQMEHFAKEEMVDCLNDFEYQDFSSDESFCAYLRKRDKHAMDLCLASGLVCFRFAD